MAQQDSTPMLTMMSMLKTDLGISTSTAYDQRLEQLLTVAQSEITKEGASDLDASESLDQQLIVMYARWLWDKRHEMTGMPRMLRFALNNRVFGMVGDSDG